MKTFVLVLPMVAALSFAACGKSPEAQAAQKEIGEALDATKNLVLKSIEDLKQKAQPQVDRLGEDLANLRAQLQQRGEQVAAKAKPLLADAEARLAEAKQRLSAARDASGEKTQEALAELQSSLRSALQAFGRAAQALQQKPETPPK